MPVTKAPTADHIRQLTPLGGRTIDKKWEDDNGHINISFYMDCYNEYGWNVNELLGVYINYFTERKLGIVDLENHFHYWRELHVGNSITTYARFLNHDKKRSHGVFFILNDDTNELACSIEFLVLHIDQSIRKSSPFPDDVMENLNKQIEFSNNLDWQFPAVLTLEK